MYIKMIGLYGGRLAAYYKKLEDGCLEFVWNKARASKLTKKEVADVVRWREWYLKTFQGKALKVVH